MMNGRQRSRATAVHHHRQHSDNFLDSSSNDRWLQSTGLQHLHSSGNDYGYYGGGDEGVQGTRGYQNAQKGFKGENGFYMEPTTPEYRSRPSSQNKNVDESSNEFSPGLLDLHAFDTELLPEVDSLTNSIS